ncbi:MAG: DUF6299 family protein [Methylocystis sp.]|uniref:DUF6299 family protein n=1 Tax=Methylocystis sp. TaxID=1911079 RepID=UPI003DA54AD7
MRSVIAATALVFLYDPAFADVTSLTIDDAAVSKSTGISVEMGAITCGKGESVLITANLIQANKVKFSSGNGSTLLVCDGSRQTWQISNTSFNGAQEMHPGEATGQATASPLASENGFPVVQTQMIKLNVKNVP